VGRRGVGQIRGLLMGSVSWKVNSLAECSVLTVK
jgi:nucleotide-binding universal stress UspA family protein